LPLSFDCHCYFSLLFLIFVKPEHCIAWSKSLFQQCFVDAIQNLHQISDKLTDLISFFKGKGNVNKKQLKVFENKFVSVLSSSFNEDDQYHLLLALSSWNNLISVFSSPDSSDSSSLASVKKKKKVNKEKGKQVLEDLILYSLSLYDKYYIDDVEQLIKDHPVDSIDEDGQLFWSG
jgi:hypothetical protein